MINFKCSQCGEKLEAPESLQGSSLKCPMCKTAVKIPKHRPSKQIPKKTGNLLIRIWQNSPAPFRTAFLATFGVISALVLAWYIFGVSQKLSGPPSNQYADNSPQPEIVDPPSFNIDTSPITTDQAYQEPTTTVFSETEIITPDRYAELISLFRMQEYCEILPMIQRLRAEASEKFEIDFNSGAMKNVVGCAQAELEKLYSRADRLLVPNVGNLQDIQRSILIAIKAEHDFLQSIMNFIDKPDSQFRLNDMAKKSQETVELYDAVLMKVVVAYFTHFPDLATATAHITQPDK